MSQAVTDILMRFQVVDFNRFVFIRASDIYQINYDPGSGEDSMEIVTSMGEKISVYGKPSSSFQVVTPSEGVGVGSE